MKKQSLFGLFAILMLMAGCGNLPANAPSISSGANLSGTLPAIDTLAFKAEYEALNNTDRPYVIVPEDINIRTLNFSWTQNLLNSGNGVLYLWFPTCPWCRVLLPELFTTMKKNGINELFYYNPREIRDQKELVDGQIVVKKPSTPEYERLLNKLDSILPEYEGLNDPSIKRVYVPAVLVIKDGKVVKHHFATLPEQTDPYTPLTEAEKIKLQTLLEDVISPLTNTACELPGTGETKKYSC